jgi:hypothetical protein
MEKSEKTVQSGHSAKPRANRTAKPRASARQLLLSDHDLADIVSKAVANAIVTYERAKLAQDTVVVSTGNAAGHGSDDRPSPRSPEPGVASENEQTSTFSRLRQEMGFGDLDSLEFEADSTKNRSQLRVTKSAPAPVAPSIQESPSQPLTQPAATPLFDTAWAEPHAENPDPSEELSWLAEELSHMASAIAREPRSRTDRETGPEDIPAGAAHPAPTDQVRPRERRRRFQLFTLAHWLDRFRSALQVRAVGRAS